MTVLLACMMEHAPMMAMIFIVSAPFILLEIDVVRKGELVFHIFFFKYINLKMIYDNNIRQWSLSKVEGSLIWE